MVCSRAKPVIECGHQQIIHREDGMLRRKRGFRQQIANLFPRKSNPRISPGLRRICGIMSNDMRVSQEGLPGLQDVGFSPDSDLAGSGMNEMDFV
ncbi:hypothetical protein D3C81_1860320 [compost metagenome]